jgi:Protein of unknown function (DUF2971).
MARNLIKVCCFAERPDIMLMWAHYASEHTGICIERDWSKLNNDDIRRMWLYPVIYGSELDVTNQLFKKFTNPLIFNLVSLHKSEEWSYEKEWRLVYGNGFLKENTNLSLPPITKIIMGNRISDDNRCKVEEFATNNKISLAIAKIDSAGRNLIIADL